MYGPRRQHGAVAELADAPDLGSGVTDVGVQVPSAAPNKNADRIQLFVPILRFLLPFRGIFALSRHKKHIFDKRSPSSERFYTFGGWAFLLALKLRIFVKIIGIRLNYGAIVKT